MVDNAQNKLYDKYHDADPESICQEWNGKTFDTSACHQGGDTSMNPFNIFFWAVVLILLVTILINLYRDRHTRKINRGHK